MLPVAQVSAVVWRLLHSIFFR